MSVQIICEDHNHEKYFIKLNYSLKHNSIKNMKNHQNYLIFKAYVCLIQTKVYIHIHNIKSPQDICIKARGSKRCTCIRLV